MHHLRYTLAFASTGLTSATQSISPLGAANTPTFGTPTAIAVGFTVQISNYNGNFTYGGTATAGGTVAISNTGLVTVSGVAANTSSNATITTTRTGYASGSADVTATSVVGTALTPTFGTPTATTDGFTVPITNYSVSYTWAGTATASGLVAIDGTGLVTVTGVAAGTSSTATITTTQTGYASGSATVTETSAAATVPSRPTSVAATSGKASLGVMWVAPASNGGSNITEYVVKYSNNGGVAGSWTRFFPSPRLPITALACTVTGLTNGTAYVIKVIARNSVGISLPSANSAPATPAAATVPSRPTSVAATSGKASLGVMWVAPASNGGSNITEYVVKYSNNGGVAGSWTRFFPSPRLPITALACTVTGLTNGTPYVIKVIAKNAVGISLPSANSAPVTPAL